MTETQQRRESQTIRSQIISIVTLLVGMITTSITENEISIVITSGLAVFGVVYGIYGRIKATKKISLAQ